MRRVVFALVALFAMSAAAQQQPQCGKPNIDFGSLTAEQAVNATSVRITADSRCTSTDVVANTGDAVSVTIDGVSKTGKVTDTAVLSTGVRFIDIAFDKSDASLDPDIRGFLFAQSADVQIGSAKYAVNIINRAGVNRHRNILNIGPALSGNSSTGATPPSSSGAVRVRYDYQYRTQNLLAQSFVQRLRKEAVLSVDTTDQQSGYVDDNRASVGAATTDLSFGDLFTSGSVGVAGRYSGAVHSDTREADGVITLAGRFPFIPSLSLTSATRYIAPPLTLNLSYGYRNARASGISYHGAIFEGTALYHLYLIDRYHLQLGESISVNQAASRPVTIPRTQKMFTATLSYLADPTTGFRVLTSYESGSFGTVLNKVKQYFFGLGLTVDRGKLTVDRSP
jgi:hypothetical protein